MRYLAYILFLLTALAVEMTAQDIAITTEYPGIVAVGEQVRLVYKVNTSGGEFMAPSFEGFYKLSGPSISYSMSTQIINGKRTSETSYSYVFYLQATREGKYTIPPATYSKGNRTYASGEVNIEVVRDASGRGAVTENRGQGVTETATSGDMFVRILLSSRDVYVGEPVVATVKFYTRVNIAGVNEIKYPSFNGFLKEEIETPQLTSLVNENIDGVTYGTGVFQRFLLFPQRSGEITIDPVQITVLIRQSSGLSDPFFGDFFQTFNTVQRVVAGNSVTLSVKPLPENRPAGFTGAVGSFEMKTSIDKDSLTVNDALGFKVTISGKGNIKLADVPVISFPPGLEVYDPKTATNVTNMESGSIGSKTFEYLIIPRSAGDFVIPPVLWSYFDPAGNSYRSITTLPVSFHVTKGAGTAAGPALFAPAAGEDIRYYGRDIRFIRSIVPDLRRSKDYLLTRRSYYSIFGFSLIAFVAIILLRREQVRRNSDRLKVLNRKAGRIAVKRLKKASNHLRRDENDRFYEEVLKALWGYTSDKLSIPLSELTRNKAGEELGKKGAGDEIINLLFELTDTCEQIRYSPASELSEPGRVYNRASGLIKMMEEQLN